MYYITPTHPLHRKKKVINLNKKRKAEDTESERDSDMGDILNDDGINSLFNGSSKEKVETKEMVRWDRSITLLENYDDIGPH